MPPVSRVVGHRAVAPEPADRKTAACPERISRIRLSQYRNAGKTDRREQDSLTQGHTTVCGVLATRISSNIIPYRLFAINCLSPSRRNDLTRQGSDRPTGVFSGGDMSELCDVGDSSATNTRQLAGAEPTYTLPSPRDHTLPPCP